MVQGEDKIPIDIAKRVVDLKLSGLNDSEICKKIKEEFGCGLYIQKVNTIFADYVMSSKLADELASKRVLEEGGTIDEDVLHENYHKMKELAMRVDRIIDNIDKYQKSVEDWIVRLETDMREIYLKSKEEDGVTIEQINEIKNSIESSTRLLRGSITELMKMMDIYSRMQSYARLQENKTIVNIDKIDFSYKINQGLVMLEKDGFLMVKPTPEYMKILEEAEKKGEVSILTRKREKKDVAA